MTGNKSSPSQPTTTLSTASADTTTPTGHSPRRSAQVGESPTPASQSSPGSPSSTGPAQASQSPGSTAATARSPPLVEVVSSSLGQAAPGTTQVDQPLSSPVPPNQRSTVAFSTSQSQESTKTSPITAVGGSQTTTPVNPAPASQSPSTSTPPAGPAAGSQRPPVQPPTKITTATIPSSQSQLNWTVKSASKAAPSQLAVSPAAVGQSHNVEPAGQSADSSPNQFFHKPTKSSQSAIQEMQKSPAKSSPAPPSRPPPPATPSSIRASLSTAPQNQSVTSNQSLTGPVSQLSTMEGSFPPSESRVNLSLLTRQAKESVKWSLRRISGRLWGGFTHD